LQCTSCGAEIADKAIVCYRCGAPTAIPAPAKRQQEAPPARRPAWGAIAALVAILAILGWFATETEPGTGARTAVYAGLAVDVLGLVWVVLRRR
jgi:hypothetical protein